MQEWVYDAVLAGKRRTCDVLPEEILVPSNHIICESVCEDPEVYDAGHNTTRALLHALVVQHGALMRLGHPKMDQRYRFLAPDGTPANRDRMAASGFKPTGCTAPNGEPLWERIVDFDSGEGVHLFEDVLLRRLARECPSAPPAK